MSVLLDRALASAGLVDVDEARLRGELEVVRAAKARLLDADLLVLGALADRIRAREVGEVVQVFTEGSSAAAPAKREPGGDAGPRPDLVTVEPHSEGLAFLRAVAVARITGPKGARVRVDWTAVGLELAQVALGFGASELAGALASKRGLPLAEGDMSDVGKKSSRVPMEQVKRQELAGFIERSGRKAVFA